MVDRQRRLTGLRKSNEVTATVGTPTGSARPSGETSLETTYSKTTGLSFAFTKRSSAWSQMNYGRKDVAMYTVIPSDPTVVLNTGDVIKVTSSEQSPDPGAGDHFLVRGTYNHKGRVVRADVRYHDEFTDNDELGS